MSFELWHFTWCENVGSIMSKEFRLEKLRENDLGGTYFTKPPDSYHKLSGHVLLVVTIDLKEIDLDPYVRRIVDRRVFDKDKNDMVETDDPKKFYRRNDYKIPSDFIIQHIIKIEVATPQEYRSRETSKPVGEDDCNLLHH